MHMHMVWAFTAEQQEFKKYVKISMVSSVNTQIIYMLLNISVL